MTKTTNYQLNQWAKSDRIMMDDFNSDNQKIDAALAACGNCKIITGSYTGNGQDGQNSPNTLTLEKRPDLLLIVSHSDSTKILFVYPSQVSLSYGSRGCNASYDSHITWGNTLSWYSTWNAEYQCNSENVVYSYFAVYLTD